MKEKLKAVRIEIAFLVLTLAFLTAFFFARSEGEKTVFPLFSVEIDGVLKEEKAEAVQIVNINTASREELETLPDVGEKLAEEIFLWRQANGPFMTQEDLLQVEGVSERVYVSLVDCITLQ
ncbi:MAG: helix-hairpin-helix domain-containing protein [Oscillospiraceae bacterium]|nr:helix-hairpin-helix domain-containing protein [Oscillospiraceae bacterium]